MSKYSSKKIDYNSWHSEEQVEKCYIWMPEIKYLLNYIVFNYGFMYKLKYMYANNQYKYYIGHHTIKLYELNEKS